MTVLWAGKKLSKEEDRQLRHLIDLLARNGATDTAEDFIRFLPEYEYKWSQEDLEANVRLDFEASIEEEL